MLGQCQQGLDELLHLLLPYLTSVGDGLCLGKTQGKTAVEVFAHAMNLLTSCLNHLEHKLVDID